MKNNGSTSTRNTEVKNFTYYPSVTLFPGKISTANALKVTANRI